MSRADPADREQVDRPVVAMANDYPAAFELAPHTHRRGQLLYAAQGVVTVATPDGVWAAPPERAVWIPVGVTHAVTMVGAVSTRSVLVAPQVCPARGARCEVLAVSPLLRSLLVEAAELAVDYELVGRDGLLMALLAAEIDRAPVAPLAVPFPRSRALAERCRAFLEQPDAGATIDGWARALGCGRRAFTRAFRRETGLSFSSWRQQACLAVALPRLAGGVPVTVVALDLGYDSPAAFTAMFKRLTGIPPSRYRR